MHVLVTEVLACPRCGSSFGLVLLARRVVERHVLEGELGCPNCRDQYPIRRGFADLRTAEERAAAAPHGEPDGDGGERAILPRPTLAPDASERGTRLAALLGLSQPRRLVLLLGALARDAPTLAAVAEGTEVIGADAALEDWAEAEGVSRIGVGGRLPFLERSLGAVGLVGADPERLDHAGHAVAPLGRLLLEDAAPGAGERLRAVGFEVLAEERGTIVAARRGAV